MKKWLVLGFLALFATTACSGSDDDSGDDDSNSSSGGTAATIDSLTVDPVTATVGAASEHDFSFTASATPPDDALVGVGLVGVPSETTLEEIQSSKSFAIVGQPTRSGTTITGRFSFTPPVAGEYTIVALVQVGTAQTLSDAKIVINASAP